MSGLLHRSSPVELVLVMSLKHSMMLVDVLGICYLLAAHPLYCFTEKFADVLRHFSNSLIAELSVAHSEVLLM